MAQRTGLRILVVEDEALISLLLEDMLDELGHAVVGPVATVEQALELVTREGEAIDAALLDVNLQGSRCDPVAELLQDKGVPIVFTTGQDRIGWEGAPDAPLLAKPYTDEQLAAALAQALAQGD